MSEEYETKRTEPHGLAKDAADERPVVDDPLLELARIVHNNKQSGSDVNSGRVGNTDYFAGLDEVAIETAPEPKPTPSRVEPTFGSLNPIADNQNTTGAAPDVKPVEPRVEQPAPRVEIPSVEELLGARAEIPVSASPEPSDTAVDIEPALQPEVRIADTQVDPFAQSAVTAQPEPVPQVQTETSAHPQFSPAFAQDLEQNLTAELEDELIGALRQTVDDNVEAPAVVSPQVRERQPDPESTPPASGFGLEHETAAQLANSFADTAPVGHKEETVPEVSAVVEPVVQPTSLAPEFSEEQLQNGFAEPAARPERTRPAINESDLLAALGPELTDHQGVGPDGAQENAADDAAGIEALFADLDFPDPAKRGVASVPEVESAPQPQASANDIDDMTWPAAADAVPQVGEDETPPPPEGYDLDAVARAMQESDPSLNGAGVLPPHSASEQKAVPQSGSRSKRGIFVAAGVVGVAALGAASFFLIDGNAVQVPSGPPPVISGLQPPLKVYPEGTQAASNQQPGKLIYDRVDGTNETGPERLIVPDNPQPAELPPAPNGSTGSADLVPGATKRVSTYIVRADGTIVSEGENPAVPSSPVVSSPAPATPAPATPVATPEPAAPLPDGNGDAPRVVSTTPLTNGSAGVQPTAPVLPNTATGSQTVPAPATPGSTPTAPAIVSGENVVPGATQPAVSGTPAIADPNGAVAPDPAVAIVSVLPRKKPNAPIQVASAPVTPSAPTQTAPANGPLNLTQPGNAPATNAPAAAPTTSGNIPAGTYIVQVTSQRSAAAATGAYEGLQRRFPAILGNRDAVIVSADLGDRGVFYRARLPMASRSEAISLCESLKGAGGDCFVRRSP